MRSRIGQIRFDSSRQPNGTFDWPTVSVVPASNFHAARSNGRGSGSPRLPARGGRRVPAVSCPPSTCRPGCWCSGGPRRAAPGGSGWRETRLALLGNYLEGVKGTLFRQTQFAEFELRSYVDLVAFRLRAVALAMPPLYWLPFAGRRRPTASSCLRRITTTSAKEATQLFITVLMMMGPERLLLLNLLKHL